jgi:integrase
LLQPALRVPCSPVMSFSLLYSPVRFLLDALLTRRQSELRLRAEVLALCHQIRVLERQVRRPRWRPADRLLLTASSRYQHAAAVRSLLADHRAPSTANTYRSALRGVMRECWRLGHLEYAELARIPEVEPVRGSRLLRGRALSRGELVAVFGHLVDQPAAAARRDAALVAILYASGGVRRAEASGLQLGDLDRGTGRLVVRGKGNKEREVWLSDEALEAVEDWLQVRGEEAGALLLPVEKDRRTVRHREADGSPARLSESTVRLACRRRASHAGLRAFSPHDLRRTSISDLLDLTGDLALVSELAGHANPATTTRYDRRPAENRRRAARSLHVPYQRRASAP